MTKAQGIKASRHQGIKCRAHRARGFTVIELGVVLVIIVLLVALVLAAARMTFVGARAAGERQVLNSLKLGVEQFKQLHGFLPPVLKDADRMSPSPVNASKEPVAYAPEDLRIDPDDPSIPPRFSACSLAYYLIGAPDNKTDGVDGPGYTQPRLDGKFTRQGKTYPSLFDVNKDRKRLLRAGNPGDGDFETKIAIVDRWQSPGDTAWPPAGMGAWAPPTHAIRYYRWEPTFYGPNESPPAGKSRGDVKNYNIPKFLGDPEKQPELRTARFALVSVGPDGEIVDDPADVVGVLPGSSQNKDNIVEFGS